MDLNLDRSMFTIFGLNMSGKTHLSKAILRERKAIIFDVRGEYDPKEFDRYVPKAKTYPALALENEIFINKVKNNPQWDTIYYPEANRTFPAMKPLMPNFRVFFDEYRHHNKAIGFDCRRPVQLTTDIVELCHFIFAFNLKGKNDIDYFNKLNRNIGETPAKLPKYHFMLIDSNREFRICEPV